MRTVTHPQHYNGTFQAGRNKAKLEAVRSDLAKTVPAAATLPILIGDSTNLSQLCTSLVALFRWKPFLLEV
jgi:hypothetical protein